MHCGLGINYEQVFVFIRESVPPILFTLKTSYM